MPTLGDIDILDEHDALLDAVDAILADDPDAVFEDFGDESDDTPMCNCGECLAGNYTCIRKD